MKFHNPYDNRIGYSCKNGQINYLDMRCTSKNTNKSRQNFSYNKII